MKNSSIKSMVERCIVDVIHCKKNKYFVFQWNHCFNLEFFGIYGNIAVLRTSISIINVRTVMKLEIFQEFDCTLIGFVTA